MIKVLSQELKKLYTGSELWIIEDKWDEYLCKEDVTNSLLFDKLYDFLEKDISFKSEEKQKLWILAHESFNFYEKKIAKEEDKELLIRYYKSFLVKKHLFQMLPQRMYLQDENGKIITRIELI